MSKASKRQFLVRVDGFPGNWAQKTGGDVSSDVAKAYDGGNPTPSLVAGPQNVDNVSVVRVYDPESDDVYLHAARQGVNSLTTTVHSTPTDANMVAVGKPTVYSNALLIHVTEPEHDASSGDLAEWGLEFAVAQVN